MLVAVVKCMSSLFMGRLPHDWSETAVDLSPDIFLPDFQYELYIREFLCCNNPVCGAWLIQYFLWKNNVITWLKALKSHFSLMKSILVVLQSVQIWDTASFTHKRSDCGVADQLLLHFFSFKASRIIDEIFEALHNYFVHQHIL